MPSKDQEIFQGFPYVVTELVPQVYHLLLLPKTLSRTHLELVGRRQAKANRLPTWLVLNMGECLRLSASETHWEHSAIPWGSFLVRGLRACEEFPNTEEMKVRYEALDKFLAEHKPDQDALHMSPPPGRLATPEEAVNLTGNQAPGVPKGLKLEHWVLGWEGECLHPSSGEQPCVITVCSQRKNRNYCALCRHTLASGKLNAYYWHDPGKYATQHQEDKETAPKGEVGYASGLDALRHECDQDDVEKRAIRWIDFLNLLQSAFDRPVIETPAGKVYASANPFDPDSELVQLTDSEWAENEVENNGAFDLMEEIWPAQKLIGFSWMESLICTGESLWLIPINEKRAYVYHATDERENQILAAIEPWDSKPLISAFFESLFYNDGEKFGAQVFGWLPTQVTNYRPELLPVEAVKAGCWSWLERPSSKDGRTSWTDLRNWLLSKLAKEPKHEPLIKTIEKERAGLKKPIDIDELGNWLNKLKAKDQGEAATLTVEDKRQILENYFATRYKETEGGQ